MFEISLDTLGVDADVPTEEQLAAGAPAVVATHVVGGSSLPLSDPQNPGRPIQFPSSAVNFGLNKTAALAFAALLKEKAELLPDELPNVESRLIIPQSQNDVQRTAHINNKLTNQ